MDTYTAVILAYQNHNLSKRNEINLSALVPVHGKPMLEWVIDALRESKKIRDIIVIGPETLDGLLGMRFVTRRISPLSATIENFRVQLFVQDKSEENTAGFFIVPSESIYLSSRDIDNFLSTYDQIRSEIAIPVINMDKLEEYNLKEKKLSVIKDNLVPGFIAVTKNIQYISSSITTLDKLHPEQNFIEFIDQPFSFLANAGKKQFSLDNIYWIHTDRSSFFISVISDQQFIRAQEFLNKPYRNRFSKIKLILNPQSGRGKHLQLLGKLLGVRYRSSDTLLSPHQFQNRILEYLNEFDIAVEMIQSKSSKNATEIAKDCSKNGYDLVIAAGGDGTINSVINGLAGTETTFAAIPTGTVNVFALQMNIPLELRSACELIARGNVKRIDLGRVNNRYFSGLSGIGFEAFIIKKTGSGIKSKIGPIAYVLSGIRYFFGYRFSRIYFSIEEERKRDFGYIILAGNGKYYSANMIISPVADMGDGLLDIIVFKKKNPIGFLRWLHETEKTKLLDYPDIEHFQIKKIKIEKHGNHYIHVDGEHYGHTPVEINVVPAALKVVC